MSSSANTSTPRSHQSKRFHKTHLLQKEGPVNLKRKKKEWSWMHEKLKSWKTRLGSAEVVIKPMLEQSTQQQPQSATGWLMTTLQEGRQLKEEFQKRRHDIFFECRNAVRQNELQESESETNIGKLKKLTSQLIRISTRSQRKEGVVSKPLEWVDRENKALNELVLTRSLKQPLLPSLPRHRGRGREGGLPRPPQSLNLRDPALRMLASLAFDFPKCQQP